MMQTIHPLLVPIILTLAIQNGSSFSPSAIYSRSITNLHAKPSKGKKLTNSSPNPTSPSSNLSQLLPKPSSRPLKLDKFGRRIYRMEDDNTIKLTKELNDSPSSGTSSPSSGESPTLSTLFKSSKEIASLASSASFRSISNSCDLKALLPQRKMSWMTLDKFGRRIQRMEDDGTVNVKKVRTRSESDVNTGDTDMESSSSTGASSSASSTSKLSELLSSTKEISGYAQSEMNFRQIDKGTDLKSLLPQRKMTWMKLDKFGRRVERMEDETVQKRVGFGDDGDGDGGSSEDNVEEDGVLEGGAVAIEGMLPDLTSTDEEKDDEDTVNMDTNNESEVDTNQQFLAELLKVGDEAPENKPTSRNLKDLLPKKPTWTKLDFKGGSVPDERRIKKPTVDNDNQDNGSLKSLLLQNKKPTWTKLDFKGVGVEDTTRSARTKKAVTKDDFNKGEYSNLKTLLPERTIQWGRRRVSGDDSENKEGDTGVSLKTLLPERKVMRRKEGSRGAKP